MTKQKTILTFAFAIVFTLGTLAGVFATDKVVSPLPELINPASFEDEGMESLPPRPAKIILSGESRSKSITLFGGEFVALVYESSALKLALNNYPFDEFVHIENGTLILTLDGAEPQTFKKADSLVVPKGFTGTWDMSEGYREFIIVDTEAMQAAMQPEGLLEIYAEVD